MKGRGAMRRIRAASAIMGAAACLSALAAGSAGAESLAPVLRGLSPSNLRIVGGVEADAARWPWQLLLHIPLVKRGVIATCGATLIAPRWVLTAAHCFGPGYDGSRPIEVYEGLSWRGKNDEAIYKQVHRVGRPVIHPGYTRRQENDIALLHLDEDAASQPIEPLASADPALERPPGQAVATGWGVVTRIEQRHGGTMIDWNTKRPIAEAGLLMPHDLMMVELPLVDVDRCRALNRDAGVVTERNLCAGSAQGGKDTCKGDSGGPLLARRAAGRYVQIGVTSWGQGCGENDHPGVYTRVSAYADWIRTVTGGAAPAAVTRPAEPPAPPTAPPADDNTAGLKIRLVAVEANRPAPLDVGAIRPGQQVAVVLGTKRPGYVIVLDEAPDGKLTQIYPNGFALRAGPGGHRQSSLEPGRELTVPDPQNPYAGFAYFVEGTAGDGVIAVFESDTPLDAVDLGADGCKIFGSAGEARAYLQHLSQEFSRDFLPKAGEDGGPIYSAVYLTYTVKR